MSATRAWRAILIGAGLWLTGTSIAGCDQMQPIDQNFDSGLGADFRPPADAVTDGGATDAPDAGTAAAAP